MKYDDIGENIRVQVTGSTSAKSPGVIFPKLAGGQNCGCHLQTNALE